MILSEKSKIQLNRHHSATDDDDDDEATGGGRVAAERNCTKTGEPCKQAVERVACKQL